MHITVLEDLLLDITALQHCSFQKTVSGVWNEILSTLLNTKRDRQWSPSLFSLRAEGPCEALSEDVSVQLLNEGDGPLVPGPGPWPPVQHHHAPGEGPAQLDTGHRSRDISQYRLRLTWRGQWRTS